MAYKENNASRILREAEEVTEMWHTYGAHIILFHIIISYQKHHIISINAKQVADFNYWKDQHNFNYWKESKLKTKS